MASIGGEQMTTISFEIDDKYLPVPLYIVVIDKVPHVAVSGDVFNWIVYVGDNWITCDKRYAPAIYTIKTYDELKNAMKQFPDLRTDFYYVLIKVIPAPLNVNTIETSAFKSLLSQLSRFIRRVQEKLQKKEKRQKK